MKISELKRELKTFDEDIDATLVLKYIDHTGKFKTRYYDLFDVLNWATVDGRDPLCLLMWIEKK